MHLLEKQVLAVIAIFIKTLTVSMSPKSDKNLEDQHLEFTLIDQVVIFQSLSFLYQVTKNQRIAYFQITSYQPRKRKNSQKLTTDI